MSFEKKKIQIDTLGEYLSEIRQKLHLAIKEVSKKTGISEKFIEGMEQGNFCKLPADVYVVGFLKQLSELYQIEPIQLIEQYKKEKSIFCHLQKKENLESSGKFSKYFSKIVITPKILSLCAGTVFITATIFYIIWQVMSLSRAPKLEIIEPVPGQVYTTSFISIKGKTDIGAMATVNDQQVFVDENGNFQTQIGVNSGPKDVVIIAKNKFDKTTKKTIGVSIELKNRQSLGGVELRLSFTEEVSLKVKIDEDKTFEQTFKKGENKLFTGKSKIILSVSNAGATEAILNGQKIGFLGRVGEVLDDVPFIAESTNSSVK